MNDEFDLPKVNIGARILADWAEELKELATSLNCSQTELITEALGQYLEQPIDTIVNRVTALERERDRVNDNTTVYPGISSELIKKLEQVIEITHNSIKKIPILFKPLLKKILRLLTTSIKKILRLFKSSEKANRVSCCAIL